MPTFDSVSPARPSDVIGSYPTQGAAEVDRAVTAAAAAQRRWARVPIPARAGLIPEAGVPDGLIQVVHGFAEPAAALAVHPGVGAVSFTGSVPTGRKVAAAAMETGPRLVSLELGGKNAMVVRPDADLDLVVDGAIFGAFGTSGQRCTSTSRLIVHPDVAAELVERIAKRANDLRLGDPTDPGTDVGPVINRASADRIAGRVADAIAEGASVACG